MISSIDVYALTVTFFGIRSIERTLTCQYFKALFLNKIAAASAIKGCAFEGYQLFSKQNRKKKIKSCKYYNVQTLAWTLLDTTKINFILFHQNRMENHKTLVDVTPVQPAFQYRGKKCRLSCGMVLLLVTL